MFQESNILLLMTILRRLNQKRMKSQNRKKTNQTAFHSLKILIGVLFSLLFFSPLKNLDGWSKWLHHRKGQCFGCLSNFSPAFQQTESATFFITKSSPVNSLTSSREPRAEESSRMDKQTLVPAIINVTSSFPRHKCAWSPFNWNYFQRRHGRIIVLRVLCLGSHLKFPQTTERTGDRFYQ